MPTLASPGRLKNARGSPPPSIANQSASMGALTLAGAGGYAVVNTGGASLTSASITGGTSQSDYGIAVSGGIAYITPDSNGSASSGTLEISVTNAVGTDTCTVTMTAEADVYDVLSGTELSAALAAIGTGGGVTVKLRPGNYSIASTVIRNRAFTSEVIIQSRNTSLKDAIVTSPIWLWDSDYVTLDSLTIRSTVEDTGAHIEVYGSTCDNIGITNNNIHGLPIDTEYETYISVNPVRRKGIYAGGCVITNLTIDDNDIHDCYTGVVIGAIGDISFQRNTLYRNFTDNVQWFHRGGQTSLIMRDNYLEGVLVPFGSELGAHGDNTQFVGRDIGASSETEDWGNIIIERNLFVDFYDTNGTQSLFFADMGSTYFYSGTIIRFNIIINASPNALLIGQAKNAIVESNLVVSNPNHTRGTDTPILAVGTYNSSGTHTIRYNVVDGFNEIGTYPENTVTGWRGATIAYSTLFDDPSADLSTKAAIIAAWTNKSGAALDTAIPQRGTFNDYSDFDANTYDAPWLEAPSLPTWTDVTDATVSTEYSTTAQQITGLSATGALVSVDVGNFTIRNAADDADVVAKGSADAIVYNNERIIRHQTSSASNEETTDQVITIGTSTDTWSVLTEAASVPYEEPNPSSTSAATNGVFASGTIFDLGWAIDNDSTITHIKIYSAGTSGAVTLKIGLRESAGVFTIVHSEDFSHGGTGEETFELSSPVSIPSTGDYYAGGYGVGSTFDRYTTQRAYKAGNTTGSSQSGFAESSSNGPVIGVIGTKP